MNCEELRDLIHAYQDGELDLVRSVEVEHHLRDCSNCAETHARYRSLHAILAEGGMPYFHAPAGLQQRIQQGLQQSIRVQRVPLASIWSWMPLSCAVAATIVVSWGSFRYFEAKERSQQMVQAVAAGHARRLMLDHLEDVASSDRHTVKPWFNGKLDFSPWVEDLADEDFRLLGGRLDYLSDRPVAALVFQRRKHIINLFLWPAADVAEQSLRESKYHGYQLFDWTGGGMSYWAVSDLNRAEMREFATIVQRQTASTR